MKKIILVFLYLSALILNPGAHAAPGDLSVNGQWQYDGFLHDGIRYPNPNPNLVLVFTFYEGGLSWLYWFRHGENGHCESLAKYTVNENNLSQLTIWENPLNAPTCPQDSGSGADEVSTTPYSIEGQELRLHLELDGRPFLYILKYIGPSEPQP